MTQCHNEDEVVAKLPGITIVRLRVWIERGWIAPALGEKGHVFTEIDIARTQLICQLRDDLLVDRESIPMLLSLLDQVYSLRRELRCVTRAIETQPEHVREQIASHIEKLRSP
ncbi:MAG: chaperone modulator CbpM [Hyphomicrobiaceae bacterium]